MAIEPLAIGVCSWSLQVKSVAELKGFLDKLGIDVVQIACGDPHHAAWEEGDRLPEAARAAGSPVIAVSYGYGKDHSTTQAKADGFVDRLTDLVTMYLRSPACQPRLKLCTTGAT